MCTASQPSGSLYVRFSVVLPPSRKNRSAYGYFTERASNEWFFCNRTCNTAYQIQIFRRHSKHFQRRTVHQQLTRACLSAASVAASFDAAEGVAGAAAFWSRCQRWIVCDCCRHTCSVPHQQHGRHNSTRNTPLHTFAYSRSSSSGSSASTGTVQRARIQPVELPTMRLVSPLVVVVLSTCDGTNPGTSSSSAGSTHEDAGHGAGLADGFATPTVTEVECLLSPCVSGFCTPPAAETVCLPSLGMSCTACARLSSAMPAVDAERTRTWPLSSCEHTKTIRQTSRSAEPQQQPYHSQTFVTSQLRRVRGTRAAVEAGVEGREVVFICEAHTAHWCQTRTKPMRAPSSESLASPQRACRSRYFSARRRRARSDRLSRCVCARCREEPASKTERKNGQHIQTTPTVSSIFSLQVNGRARSFGQRGWQSVFRFLLGVLESGRGRRGRQVADRCSRAFRRDKRVVLSCRFDVVCRLIRIARR